MLRSTFLFIAFLLLFPLMLSGQDSRSLTVRNAHSMAVDPRSGEIFLFGGADEKRVYGDLWKLGDDGWEFVTDEGPRPRTFAGLVFHEGRNSLILFGGEDALFGSETDPPGSLSDTWEFVNGKWERLEPESAPAARSAAAMAYDPLNGRIVLFGGYSQSNGKGERLGDTWLFRNGNWTRLDASGPIARVGAAAVFDPVRRAVLLFGGSTEDRAYGAGSGETWLLRRNEWTKLQTVQPPNIFNPAMAYSTDGKEVIRFGGWNGGGRTSETWILREYGWTRIGTSGAPAPRNHSAMVYDPVRKRAVLFGGHDGENVFGDLWLYAADGWRELFASPPLKRVANGH